VAVTRGRAGKEVYRAHFLAYGGLIGINAAAAVFRR
jgi:hypothetical protein